jgi:hypothetical protein
MNAVLSNNYALSDTFTPFNVWNPTTDTANGLNPATGIYTVSESGYYYITVSLHVRNESDNDINTFFTIRVNGSDEVNSTSYTAYNQGTGLQIGGSLSLLAIVPLNAGDTVSIEGIDFDDNGSLVYQASTWALFKIADL